MPEEKKNNMKKAYDHFKEAVESFTPEQFEDFLKGFSSLGTHKYSMLNRLLIAQQAVSYGFSPSVVGGYKNFWKKHKRYPKKGSKPIWILVPVFPKKKKDEDAEKENKRGPVFYRYGRIYDYNQTDGEPVELSGFVKSSELNESFSDLVGKVSGKIPVIVEPLEESCGGFVNTEGEIHINELFSEAEQVHALLHELSHYVLDHHVSLKASVMYNYSVGEIEAETVAYFLSKHFRIEPKSAEYVYNWKRNLCFPSFTTIIRGFNLALQVLEGE